LIAAAHVLAFCGEKGITMIAAIAALVVIVAASNLGGSSGG
jgi:hypothetical protein